MKSIRPIAVFILLAVFVTSIGAGCRTLRQVAALRSVRFNIDQVADVEFAGVSLGDTYESGELSASEGAYIMRTLAQGEAPLEFTLHLDATNPAENDVTARLVEMDWTLLLDGTETVSGTFDQEVALPPGTTKDLALGIQLDLFRFFERGAQDLVELALAVAGAGGEPTDITLRATPVIDTIIGPIRYPEPITITLERVGGT